MPPAPARCTATANIARRCSLQVQETLDYPAAAKDAELLEKLQAVLENRSPKAPPQVLVDNVQPVPRLWLASIEFSAFEPRNGRMQRYIQHRAALSFSYLDEYVSRPEEYRHPDSPGNPDAADKTPPGRRNSPTASSCESSASRSPPAKARPCRKAPASCSRWSTTAPG